MRIVLLMALTLVSLMVVPAASASEPAPIGPPVEPPLQMCNPLECTILWPDCLTGYYATVCAYSANGCIVLMADGHSREVPVEGTVPGQSIWTPGIHVGPIHIDPVHVWTDPIYVGYSVWTPDNGASNTLCYWQYADAYL